MESAIPVSSAKSKSKGNLVANSQSNFSDMMEKKQLIVKPPSGNGGERNRDQGLALNLKSTQRVSVEDGTPIGNATNFP